MQRKAQLSQTVLRNLLPGTKYPVVSICCLLYQVKIILSFLRILRRDHVFQFSAHCISISLTLVNLRIRGKKDYAVFSFIAFHLFLPHVFNLLIHKCFRKQTTLLITYLFIAQFKQNHQKVRQITKCQDAVNRFMRTLSRHRHR